MKSTLFSFIFTFMMVFTSSAFAVSCSDEGSLEYNATTLGFTACVAGLEKRLAGTVTTTACSNAGEIEWTGSDLVYCNGSYETSFKCGTSQGACTQTGQQHYNAGAMQMCDGSDWYFMNSNACVSTLPDISWVAVGSSDQLLVSSDGLSWYAADLPTTESLNINDVAYGNGRWVAVGKYRSNNLAVMITSTDGKTWTEIDLSSIPGTLYYLGKIQYVDGLWMTVENTYTGGANSASVITSSDGLNWSQAGLANTGSVGIGLVKGKNYWVLGGGKHYAYSADNGANWTTYGWGSTGSWTRGIIYANGAYIIANPTTNTSIVVHEDDIGVNHTIIPTAIGKGISAGPYTFVGNSLGGSSIKYISSNAVDDILGSWTSFDTGFDLYYDYRGPIAFGNGQLIIASEDGQIASSTDYSTITGVKIPYGTSIIDGAYGGVINDPGEFSFTDVVGVSLSAVVISDAITISSTMTSTQKVYAGNGADIRVNGGSWVAGDGTTTVTANDTLEISLTTPVVSLKQTVSTIQVGTYITHWGVTTEEYLVSFAISVDDNTLHISKDGSNWLVLDMTTMSASLTSIADIGYGDGKWVVSTSDGIILSSDDAFNWQVSDVSSYYASGDTMTFVAYGNGRWFIHSDSKTNLLTSTDGVNWSEIAGVGSGQRLKEYKGDWFGVFGGWNLKKSTDNGLTWTTSKSISTHPASRNYDVCIGNGRMVAVNSSGYMSAYSDDAGASWTEFNPGRVRDYQCVYANGYYVSAVVGGSPSFAYSTDGITWTNNDTTGSSTKGRGILFANGTWYAADQARLTTTTDITLALSGSTIAYDPPGSIEEMIYGGTHNDPGEFSFTDVVGVSLSAVVISDAITISPTMTSAQKVYAGNGADIRVNGGSWVAGDGTTTVTANDTLEISLTTHVASLKQMVSTIQVGTHITHWGVTTEEYLVSFAISTSDNNLHLSRDDSDWLVLDMTTMSASLTDIVDIGYGDGKWVATTSDGIVLSSDDAFDWQVSDVSSYYASGDAMTFVAYGNGRWFVHGYYATNLLTSTDGVNWSEITGIGGGRRLKEYKGDWYGEFANWNLKKSTDNGLTWTTSKSISTHPASTNYDVCIGNGRMVAVNSSGYMSAYSDDAGASWTEFNPGRVRDYQCVYANGYYVSAVVAGNPSFAYSTDGITWTNNDTTGSSTKGRGILFANGTWYAADQVRLTTTTDITLALSGSTIAYAPPGYIEEMIYGGTHNDPGNFIFTDQVSVSASTVITSNSMTMDASLTTVQKVYASNGAEVQKNAGSWTAGDGTTTVTASDTLAVRHTSSAVSLTEKVSTIQVGSHITHWSTTTE